MRNLKILKLFLFFSASVDAFTSQDRVYNSPQVSSSESLFRTAVKAENEYLASAKILTPEKYGSSMSLQRSDAIIMSSSNTDNSAKEPATIFTPEQFGNSASQTSSELMITPSANTATSVDERIDPTYIPSPSPPIVDLDTVSLVAGQENFGLAIVLFGEAVWSFIKAPSVDHGLKTLLPAIVAAGILGTLSGPMIASGDANTIAIGLAISTAVSIGMGVVFVARLTAPYSPSAKESPALGLLVAVAGFFSFSQNLVVDGFVTLPSVPSLPTFPSLPTIELPF